MGSGVVVGGTKSGHVTLWAQDKEPSVEMSDIVGPREGKLYLGNPSLSTEGALQLLRNMMMRITLRYRFSFEMMTPRNSKGLK